MEFTSFEANAAQSAEKRRMVILRCEDAPLLGLFAQDEFADALASYQAEFAISTAWLGRANSKITLSSPYI
jgi:hypothetical protein